MGARKGRCKKIREKNKELEPKENTILVSGNHTVRYHFANGKNLLCHI